MRRHVVGSDEPAALRCSNATRQRFYATSCVRGGNADEITVNPSSLHGQQANGNVLILKDDSLTFELFSGSDGLTYIYGNNDLTGYFGGGKQQTIYGFGVGTHVQRDHRTD